MDRPTVSAPIRARTTLSFAPLQEDINRPEAPMANPAVPVIVVPINFRLLIDL